jgi:hypothetical protein
VPDPSIKERLLECVLGTLRDDAGAAAAVEALNAAGAGLPEPEHGLSWDLFLDESATLQLLAMLHDRLQKNSNVPATGRERCRKAYLNAAMANMKMVEQLAAPLAALRAAGIDVMLLKGVCLAQEVYPTIALRSMSDIDLLVRGADVERARAVLLADGYQESSDEPIEEQRKRHHHLAPLGGPGRRVIELHWALEPPESTFRVDLDAIWRDRRAMQCGTAAAWKMSAEHQLLHLCLHGARHVFEPWGDRFGLKTVCDIRAVLARETIDWDSFAASAASWHAERAAYFMLTLARDWLNAAVPAEALERLSSGGVDPQWFTWARAQVVLPGATQAVGGQTARALAHGSVRQKMGVFFRRLFPPAGEIRERFDLSMSDRWLLPYYVKRWWQVVVRDGPIAWRVVRRDAGTKALIDSAGRAAQVRQWMLERPERG